MLLNKFKVHKIFISSFFLINMLLNFNNYNNNNLYKKQIGHWRGILNLSKTPTSSEFAAVATAAGDAVLKRIYEHVKSDSKFIIYE